MKGKKQTLDERCATMRERQLQLNRLAVVGRTLLEVPLTVQQAAPLWGQSPKATRRYFAKVDGVRVIEHSYRYDPKRRRYVRKYDTVLIPPSVLEREICKITKIAA